GNPWTVAAVADFDGDGKADILWRNVQTAQTVVWTMNGTTVTSAGLTDAAAPAGWSVVGTGDFNGDGKADILWRNDTTHETAIWEMNGAHFIGGGGPDAHVGGDWIFT
ncbi:MAG TPA: VCBS repeat-containing protein, partial [Phenylobacterium sp.]|nr:VCBS repeat-containing protein [Phenylobacterium sp.]